VILAMATVTVADTGWLTAGERAAELRTLHAIGWPAWGVVRLVAWEAVLLGLAGGLVASVLDVAGSLAVVHHAPVRLLPAAAMVAGAGAVVSLAAAGLAAAAGRARGSGVSC
jgi:ABC-type antimicrobial peptide transport system permease subunit